MEIKVSLLVAAIMAALCVVTSAMSIPRPSELDDNQIESANPDADNRRAIWLDSRQLSDAFKEMVMDALVELEDEGRIAKGVVNEDTMDMNKSKRGRWQGFCFKKTRSGRLLPYICWKGARK